MMRHSFFIILTSFFIGCPARASFHETLVKNFNAAGIPQSAHLKAEEIWAGKCVSVNSPNTLLGGAAYFHVTSDPHLGKIFRAIPAFRYYVANFPNDFQRYIYLNFVTEHIYLKMTATELATLFDEDLAQPDIDYSAVGSTGGAWTTTTTVNKQSLSGVRATFVTYFKEAKAADGKPIFYLRHDITDERNDHVLSGFLGTAMYCYLSENKGVGEPSKEGTKSQDAPTSACRRSHYRPDPRP